MNIYDIAKKAGVSIATVSRVINNSDQVSEKNRKKVLNVIEQENYIPNIFARGLTLNSVKAIGILCPVISDINHAKAVSIIERLLRKNNFSTFLICVNNNYEDKTKYLLQLINKRVDAIIVIGSSMDEINKKKYVEDPIKNIPIFVINGLIEMENFYSILCDEETAIMECINQLCQKGYRKIVYLYDSETYSGYQKLSGYKKGLKKCKIDENTNLILKIDDSESSIEDSYNAINTLIDSKIKFDSIITSDDIIAVGALKALNQNNIDVPIIGFNNSRFSQCTIQEITSIDNMIETICFTAVNILIDVLNDKDVPHKIVISHKIIERDTFKLK